MVESSLSNEREKASFLAASAPRSGDWLLTPSWWWGGLHCGRAQMRHTLWPDDLTLLPWQEVKRPACHCLHQVSSRNYCVTRKELLAVISIFLDNIPPHYGSCKIILASAYACPDWSTGVVTLNNGTIPVPNRPSFLYPIPQRRWFDQSAVSLTFELPSFFSDIGYQGWGWLPPSPWIIVLDFEKYSLWYIVGKVFENCIQLIGNFLRPDRK